MHKEDPMLFDGMALIQLQQPQSEQLTFKNMGEIFINHSWKIARHVTDVIIIHIVLTSKATTA